MFRGPTGTMEVRSLIALLQTIRSFDLSVYHFLNAYAGNRILDRLAAFEENDNLLKGGIFFAMYVHFWFGRGPNQDKQRRAIIAILIGTVMALVVSRTIADLAPFRIRPMFGPHHPYAFPISLNMENWSSFPSDTAAYFFALSYGLAHLSRRCAVPIGLYTAGWICLPRMFLGEHYASDIVVGATIGIVLVWASIRSERLQQKVIGRALAFMDAKPQVFYAAAFLVCFEMGVLFDDVRSAARGLFHAALAEPRRDFVHAALAVCTFLGLVVITAVVFWVLVRRYSVMSDQFGPVRVILRGRHSRIRVSSPPLDNHR
jgi:membrane-associated phospholipid phosphatase